MGKGVKIEVVEKKPWPPEKLPLAGAIDWVKKYWPYLTIGGIGTAIIGWLLGRK